MFITDRMFGKNYTELVIDTFSDGGRYYRMPVPKIFLMTGRMYASLKYGPDRDVVEFRKVSLFSLLITILYAPIMSAYFWMLHFMHRRRILLSADGEIISFRNFNPYFWTWGLWAWKDKSYWQSGGFSFDDMYMSYKERIKRHTKRWMRDIT